MEEKNERRQTHVLSVKTHGKKCFLYLIKQGDKPHQKMAMSNKTINRPWKLPFMGKDLPYNVNGLEYIFKN